MKEHEKISKIEAIIGDIVDQAEELIAKVDATVSYARSLNDKGEGCDPLDEQPYGESIARTQDIVESINQQLSDLDDAVAEEGLDKVAEKALYIEQSVVEHRLNFEDSFTKSFIVEATETKSPDEPNGSNTMCS